MIEYKKMKKKFYAASTLVEALLAIVIAGIAAGVLMRMSGEALQEVIKTEKSDALVQLASQSSVVVRRIASEHNASKSGFPLFPYKQDEVNYCYAFKGDFTSKNVSFVESGAVLNKICFNREPWDGCKENSLTWTQLNLTKISSRTISDSAYKFFCVDDYNEGTQTISGTVVVGLRNCPKKEQGKSTCIYKYKVHVYVKGE